MEEQDFNNARIVILASEELLLGIWPSLAKGTFMHVVVKAGEMVHEIRKLVIERHRILARITQWLSVDP